jgi:hypothetical protein
MTQITDYSAEKRDHSIGYQEKNVFFSAEKIGENHRK